MNQLHFGFIFIKKLFLEVRPVNKISLFFILLSLVMFYGCPLTDSNQEEEIVVEEEYYDSEEYDFEENDDPKHIENPGDLAGSLIF